MSTTVDLTAAFSGLDAQITRVFDVMMGKTPVLNGPPGATGPTGFTGVIGPQGATGITGATGPRGATGLGTGTTLRGPWGSGESYNTNGGTSPDAVTYNGAFYVCKLSIADSVITPDLDPDHWIKYVAQGATGSVSAIGMDGQFMYKMGGIMAATNFMGATGPDAVYFGRTIAPFYGSNISLGMPGSAFSTLYLQQVNLGNGAGAIAQANSNAIAVGYQAGYSNQATNTVAMGYQAGYQNQWAGSIALGPQAAKFNQSTSAIAIGTNAGYSNQRDYSIAIGTGAGASNQTTNAIAIGTSAGYSNQQDFSIAIGNNAGYSEQQEFSIAIGPNAGYSDQQDYSIAIGPGAGASNQSTFSVAVGYGAGQENQGPMTVALGYNAGLTNMGSNSIAIGHFSDITSEIPPNTIAISGGSYAIDAYPFSNALYVNPVRILNVDGTALPKVSDPEVTTFHPVMLWNSTSSEMYGTTSLSFTNATPNATGPDGPQMLLGAHVVPTSDLTYDLGATGLRFRDLYVGGNSIFMGDSVALSASNGNLNITSDGKISQIGTTTAGSYYDPIAQTTTTGPIFSMGATGSAGPLIVQSGLSPLHVLESLRAGSNINYSQSKVQAGSYAVNTVFGPSGPDFTRNGMTYVPQVAFNSSRGTAAAPTNLQDRDIIGALYFKEQAALRSAIYANKVGPSGSSDASLKFALGGSDLLSINSTGPTRDGLATGPVGPNIEFSAPVYPTTDATYSLGATGYQFKDVHFSGSLYNNGVPFQGGVPGLTYRATGPTGPTGGPTGPFGQPTLQTDAHILPTADLTYDLGATGLRFRDLYVGGSTVYLGDSVALSASNGTLNITSDGKTSQLGTNPSGSYYDPLRRATVTGPIFSMGATGSAGPLFIQTGLSPLHVIESTTTGPNMNYVQSKVQPGSYTVNAVYGPSGIGGPPNNLLYIPQVSFNTSRGHATGPTGLQNGDIMGAVFFKENQSLRGAIYVDKLGSSEKEDGSMHFLVAQSSEVFSINSTGPDESIAGANMKLKGHVYPNDTNFYNLGATGYQFKDIHFSGSLYNNGAPFQGGVPGLTYMATGPSLKSAANILPSTTGVYDLGDTEYQFKDVHFSGSLYNNGVPFQGGPSILAGFGTTYAQASFGGGYSNSNAFSAPFTNTPVVVLSPINAYSSSGIQQQLLMVTASNISESGFTAYSVSPTTKYSWIAMSQTDFPPSPPAFPTQFNMSFSNVTPNSITVSFNKTQITGSTPINLVLCVTDIDPGNGNPDDSITYSGSISNVGNTYTATVTGGAACGPFQPETTYSFYIKATNSLTTVYSSVLASQATPAAPPSFANPFNMDVITVTYNSIRVSFDKTQITGSPTVVLCVTTGTGDQTIGQFNDTVTVSGSVVDDETYTATIVGGTTCGLFQAGTTYKFYIKATNTAGTVYSTIVKTQATSIMGFAPGFALTKVSSTPLSITVSFDASLIVGGPSSIDLLCSPSLSFSADNRVETSVGNPTINGNIYTYVVGTGAAMNVLKNSLGEYLEYGWPKSSLAPYAIVGASGYEGRFYNFEVMIVKSGTTLISQTNRAFDTDIYEITAALITVSVNFTGDTDQTINVEISPQNLASGMIGSGTYTMDIIIPNPQFQGSNLYSSTDIPLTWNSGISKYVYNGIDLAAYGGVTGRIDVYVTDAGANDTYKKTKLKTESFEVPVNSITNNSDLVFTNGLVGQGTQEINVSGINPANGVGEYIYTLYYKASTDQTYVGDGLTSYTISGTSPPTYTWTLIQLVNSTTYNYKLKISDGTETTPFFSEEQTFTYYTPTEPGFPQDFTMTFSNVTPFSIPVSFDISQITGTRPLTVELSIISEFQGQTFDNDTAYGDISEITNNIYSATITSGQNIGSIQQGVLYRFYIKATNSVNTVYSEILASQTTPQYSFNFANTSLITATVTGGNAVISFSDSNLSSIISGNAGPISFTVTIQSQNGSITKVNGIWSSPAIDVSAYFGGGTYYSIEATDTGAPFGTSGNMVSTQLFINVPYPPLAFASIGDIITQNITGEPTTLSVNINTNNMVTGGSGSYYINFYDPQGGQETIYINNGTLTRTYYTLMEGVNYSLDFTVEDFTTFLNVRSSSVNFTPG